MRFSRPVVAAAAGVLTLSLSACGKSSAQETTDNSGNQVAIDDKTLTLVAETYPLQYVLHEVAGNGFDISSLTAGATDARKAKVSAAGEKAVSRADLVLTMDGFNPTIDKALAGKKNVTNVNSTVDLKKVDGATQYDFWLDPSRLARLTQTVADKLSAADPNRSSTYQENAATLNKELLTLDDTMNTTLATCKYKTVFTERPDFAYLSEGTKIKPRALLSADGAGSATTLAHRVSRSGVKAIYSEPGSNKAVMRSIADKADVALGSLDPMETYTDDSVGDYQDGMKANVRMLTKGQKCTPLAPDPIDAYDNTDGADD